MQADENATGAREQPGMNAATDNAVPVPAGAALASLPGSRDDDVSAAPPTAPVAAAVELPDIDMQSVAAVTKATDVPLILQSLPQQVPARNYIDTVIIPDNS
jgi:hypothetical protein